MLSLNDTRRWEAEHTWWFSESSVGKAGRVAESKKGHSIEQNDNVSNIKAKVTSMHLKSRINPAFMLK